MFDLINRNFLLRMLLFLFLNLFNKQRWRGVMYLHRRKGIKTVFEVQNAADFTVFLFICKLSKPIICVLF